MFNSLNLRTQLFLAFGLLVLLLICQGGMSYIGASSGHNSFAEYRNLARDSNLAGRVQANLLIVRLAAVKYLQQQSVDNEQEFDQRLNLLEDLLGQANSEIKNPQRAELVQQAVKEVNEYKNAFEKIKSLYSQRHSLVENTLDPTGILLRKTIAEVMNSAYQDKDTSASFYAAQVNQALLLARLYVVKYLVTNNVSDYQRAQQEFSKLNKALNTLTGQIENQSRIKLLNTFKVYKEEYARGLQEIKTVIVNRNALITSVLDKKGPSAADKLEQVKLSVKREQDMLGPLAEKAASNARC